MKSSVVRNKVFLVYFSGASVLKVVIALDIGDRNFY